MRADCQSNKLTMNEYTVKDSFMFPKEITKNDCNYVIASFDIERLFNNKPLEETIENGVNDLFFDQTKLSNLMKQDIYDLLLAAPKESFFDNIIYI